MYSNLSLLFYDLVVTIERIRCGYFGIFTVFLSIYKISLENCIVTLRASIGHLNRIVYEFARYKRG